MRHSPATDCDTFIHWLGRPILRLKDERFARLTYPRSKHPEDMAVEAGINQFLFPSVANRHRLCRPTSQFGSSARRSYANAGLTATIDLPWVGEHHPDLHDGSAAPDGQARVESKLRVN